MCVCVCVCVCEWERETERDRQTDRQKGEKQKDRERLNGGKKMNGILGDSSNRANREKEKNGREKIFNEIILRHTLGLENMSLHIIQTKLKCPAKTDF